MATYTPQTGVPIGDSTPYDLRLFTQGYDDASAAIFTHEGNLFAFSNWTPAPLTDGLLISRSTDGGVTWTNLDTANGPLATGAAAASGSAIVRADGSAGVLHVAWIDEGAGTPTVQLVDFDLVAGTWGTPHGVSGAPEAPGGLTAVWHRWHFQDQLAVVFNAPGGSGLWVALYDISEDTWDAPIDIGINITTLPGWGDATRVIEQMSGCIDVDDNIYVFFSTAFQSSDDGWSFRVFCQQFLQTDNSVPNTTAGFQDFPGQGDRTQTNNDMFTHPLGVPCIAGTNIFFPIDRIDSSNPPFHIQYQCGWLGVGVPSVSSWAESTIPVDPGHTIGAFPNTALSAGMSFFDGAMLYVVYRGNSNPADDDIQQLRLCQCAPSGDDPSTFTWTAQTVALITDAPMSGMSSPVFYEPTIFVEGSTVLIDVTCFEGDSPSNSARFFLSDQPPPPSTGCPVAWLAINEPGTSSPFTPNTWVDQSHRLHMSEAISISWLVRQRGTAKIPLTISGDDSYMPTIGSQVCLWDITALADFEVFSGTIDDFEVHWHGQTGQRIVTLTCVSLDQVFDTIRVPSLLFTDKTAGFIFTALFAYATGSPVTLGTVDAGATIAQFVIQDWPSIAEMFTRLATISEYVWGVDPGTGSVYFHAPNVTPSPFTLDAHDVVWERFDLKEERHDYRNRQILKPNVNTAVSSSEYFQGSAQSSFTMLRPVDQITNAWLTQNTQNSALGTFTGQPSPGDRITVGYASTSGSGFHWSAAATFAVGAIIVDSNGYFQKVTASAGVTGATEPVWVEIFGQVTNDNLVTWTNQGPAGFADGNAADYTFVTALDNREFGQVLIGATLPDTITNLWHAINSIQGFAGATFSLPTWENPLLNADTPTGTTLTVRNKPAGQGFIAALAWTGAVFSFDSNVTHGGITTFGTNVITFGVEGQTTGGSIFTIVYNPGSNIVKSATPLQPGNNLQIEYKASNAGFVIVENTAEVIDRARIEGGTGKYQQSSSDDTATSLPQALQLAQQQLAAFDTIPKTFQFTCMRAGLYVGQVLDISMANPQPALTNASWFIQEIQAEVVPIYGPGGVANRWLPNGGHFKYTVTCIDVAQIGSWLDFWLGLGSGGSGGGSAVYPGGGATSSTTTSGAARIIATGAAALNTAAIASGAAAATVTVATPGVLGTDTLAWSFNADPTGVTGYAPSATGTLYIVAFPVAGNVKFIVVNNTGAPITPGAITLNFNVVR